MGGVGALGGVGATWHRTYLDIQFQYSMISKPWFDKFFSIFIFWRKFLSLLVSAALLLLAAGWPNWLSERALHFDLLLFSATETYNWERLSFGEDPSNLIGWKCCHVINFEPIKLYIKVKRWDTAKIWTVSHRLSSDWSKTMSCDYLSTNQKLLSSEVRLGSQDSVNLLPTTEQLI